MGVSKINVTMLAPGPKGSDATVPDASTTVKGKIQLAGDLGGSAATPIIKRTVTKTIAPLSSGLLADYYTDGVSDNVEIQTAINAVGAAGGGEIKLRAGKYYISAQINIPYNNISITGEGIGNTTLFLVDHTNTNMFYVGDNNNYYNHNNFSDFTLDGNISNQDQDIPNSVFVDSTGIFLIGCSYSTILRVGSNNFCKYGLLVAHVDTGDSKQASHNRIENCEVNGNYFDGIVVNYSHYNIIVGNAAQNATHGGIYSKGSNGTVITGNDTSKNANGIIVQYADAVVVSGNSAIDNRLGGSGISLFEAARCVVSGNVVQNSSFDGIRLNAVHDSIIIGNTCNSNGQSVGSARNGIEILFVSSGSDIAVSSPNNNIITGNQCGNYTGVGLQQLYGININYAGATNNLIYGNYLSGNLTSPIIDIGTTNRKFNNFGSTDFYVPPRIITMANATSFTPTATTADQNIQINTQSVGTLTANAPSGSPTDGQRLTLRIKSTNVQTYSWNAIYRGGTDVPLPTASSGASKTDYIGFVYNAADSRWDCLAVTRGF